MNLNAATSGGGARLLADGNQLPVLGLGVWQVPAGRECARRTGRTPAQVLLRWGLQHGLVVVAKSTHRDRIHENAQIHDFSLSAQDMAELDALDRTGGTDRALETKWW